MTLAIRIVEASPAPAGLTARQELFARELAAGKSQADALRSAYPASRSWKAGSVHQRASRLASNAQVCARVSTFAHEVAVNAAYTRAEAMREANEALLLAKVAGDVRAMLSAITLKARLSGLFVHRVETSSPLDNLSHEDVKRLIGVLDELDD